MSEKKVLATVEGREITEIMLIDYWLALASKTAQFNTPEEEKHS